MTTQAVEIQILGKVMKVNCPTGQETALQEAANEVESRIEALAGKSKVANHEQLLLFAALNLCHELQDEKRARQAHDWEVSTRLGQLDDRLSKALLSATTN